MFKQPLWVGTCLAVRMIFCRFASGPHVARAFEMSRDLAGSQAVLGGPSRMRSRSGIADAAGVQQIVRSGREKCKACRRSNSHHGKAQLKYTADTSV